MHIFRHFEQKVLPHADGLFMPLHIALHEQLEFQIVSVLKLKLQDMTAGSLSLAGVERMNWNTLEHSVTGLRK